MTHEERKIQAAHEKHAWTLAFIVFGAFAFVVYLLEGWLQRQHSSWAELAYFVLYLVAFFAIFALSTVKDWFLDRFNKPNDD